MRVTVLQGQTVQDLAIEYLGAVDRMFEVAVAAGVSVTDDLPAGMVIDLPDQEAIPEIVSYYKSKNIHPATGI